jgi:hypothetical protein
MWTEEMRTSALAVLAAAMLSSACIGRRSPIAHSSAPDPSGCFVEVFAQEEMKGPRDFINGPAKYWKLDELPFGADWHNRIRSLRVGPAATLILWTRQGFEGESIRLGPDRNHPRLLEDFRSKIASLAIGCHQPSAQHSGPDRQEAPATRRRHARWRVLRGLFERRIGFTWTSFAAVAARSL